MATEAATLHPDSRCEVNPGGKRGLIRQEKHCVQIVYLTSRNVKLRTCT